MSHQVWSDLKVMPWDSLARKDTELSQSSRCSSSFQLKLCIASEPTQKITLLIKSTEYNLSNHNTRYNLGYTVKNSEHADIKEKKSIAGPQIEKLSKSIRTNSLVGSNYL